MNLKSIKECDRRASQRILNFKLPNSYKKIGWIGFIVVLTILLSTKFFDGDHELLKDILRRLLLAFLFVVVLSREKIEDERIQAFRSKSFSFAFLIATLYVLFQPFLNWIAFALVKPEKAAFKDLGDFVILWLMLIAYLMFFNILKRQN